MTKKKMTKGQKKIGKVMHEFKERELHSGSKKGPLVKGKKQAIAIALSEARKAGEDMPKKQGYNARLDESLGMRNKGKKKQSLKSRRDESEGMEKAQGKRKYSAVKSMKKRGKK